MRAIITKVNKKSTTTITGKVIDNGRTSITLAVINKDGGTDIKRFRKDNANVILLED